jgi:hypothetical protein
MSLGMSVRPGIPRLSLTGLSNLLRLLVGTLRLKSVPGVPYPPLDVFRETGYLTFEQLSSLRHRGAFSTVSYTFTTSCQLTQRLKDVYLEIDETEDLLREWYQVRRPTPVISAPVLTRFRGR